MYSLGWLYEHGRGAPVDPVRARHFYKRAAEAGMAEARAGLSPPGR